MVSRSIDARDFVSKLAGGYGEGSVEGSVGGFGAIRGLGLLRLRRRIVDAHRRPIRFRRWRRVSVTPLDWLRLRRFRDFLGFRLLAGFHTRVDRQAHRCTHNQQERHHDAASPKEEDHRRTPLFCWRQSRFNRSRLGNRSRRDAVAKAGTRTISWQGQRTCWPAMSSRMAKVL